MRPRLGWTISYKSLYFVHPSLELVPLFTGMRERSIDWKTVRVLWLLGYRESWLSNLGFIPCKIGTLRSGNAVRRQWKRCWKIDFASFETFSPFYQVIQLLKRKEVRLKLKRGGRVRVQTECKIHRLAVPVVKSTKTLVSSRCSCARTAKKCTKKRDARAELLFCLNKPTEFSTFPLPLLLPS